MAADASAIAASRAREKQPARGRGRLMANAHAAPLSDEFAALASKLPPALRHLLVDNADPETVPLREVLEALGGGESERDNVPPSLRLLRVMQGKSPEAPCTASTTADVVAQTGALSSEACRLLLLWETSPSPRTLPLAAHAAHAIAALLDGPHAPSVRAVCHSATPSCAARLLARPYELTAYAPAALARLRAALSSLLVTLLSDPTISDGRPVALAMTRHGGPVRPDVSLTHS